MANEEPDLDRGSEPNKPRLTTGLFNIAETVRTLSGVGVSKTKVNPAQGLLKVADAAE